MKLCACDSEDREYQWDGYRCECYYDVRHAIGHKTRIILRRVKFRPVVKKTHDLVCIRYRGSWGWGGRQCEYYCDVRNTIGHKVRIILRGTKFRLRNKPMNRYLNWIVLITTCKQLVWSIRIDRNMPIWVLCLIPGSSPGAALPLEVTGGGGRSLLYAGLPGRP
jgi:hypothetical protein